MYYFCHLVYVFAQMNLLRLFPCPIRSIIVGTELDERPHNQNSYVLSHCTYRPLRLSVSRHLQFYVLDLNCKTSGP